MKIAVPMVVAMSVECLLSSGVASATVLQVGPGKTYTAPCAALNAAHDNDTVEIAAGTYAGDVCGFSANGLTIRGMGGRAKIDAAGQNAQGKGTWVIGGNDTTVENIEFTGAAVPDLNGAGIRADGKNLTIRNCYFHDNQDGILGGAGAVVIEGSEFAHNGNCIDPSGCAHNMYIDHADSFTLRGSYSHSAKDGHLVKSRAAVNYILYNRLTGEADGTESYEIDLPNGGTSYVIGNLIQQGANTGNPTMLAYREEGGNAQNPGTDLYVVNNTFVNGHGTGTFIDANTSTPVIITNNAFVGGGTITSQASAVKTTNYSGDAAMFVDAAGYDYHLMTGSPLVNAGTPVGMGAGFDLNPLFQYIHPTQLAGRIVVGTIDIGAYELGGEIGAPDGGVSDMQGPSSDGGVSDGSVARSDGGGGTDGGGKSSPSGGCDLGGTTSRSGETAFLAIGLLVLFRLFRRARALMVIVLLLGSSACSDSQTQDTTGNGDGAANPVGDGGTSMNMIDAHVAPPIGSTLARITVVDTRTTGAAGSNVFVTFGHVFVAGDVPPSATLAARAADGSGVLLQVDKKATYADGSLRHAVITAVLPQLAAGEKIPIDLVSAAATAPGGGLDVTALAGTAFDAKVTAKIGSVSYTASAKPLLASATQTWLDGPVVKEVSVKAPLVDGSGNAHPHLIARFQVRMYAGASSARVDVIVENDWAYAAAPSNFTYDLDVSVGGSSVYSKTGLTHYHHARFRQTYNWGRDPEPFVQHDPAYLIKTGAVPNYDPTIKIDETALAGYESLPAPPWEPMQIGEASNHMPGTGGRIDIGLIPGWAGRYLLSMDPRAARATFITAEGAGSWSIHYRDKDTDRPASLADHPYMTILGDAAGTVNPATNKSEAFPDCAGCGTPNEHDTAHQPSLAYVPYILTGDHYYLEELQFWCAYNLFQSNPAYREFGKGLFHPDQVRGQAWSMRTLGETAAFTPDADPMKSYFVGRLNDNITNYTSRYVNGPDANALGLNTDGYAFSYVNGTGVATWQDDFFTSSIGHLVELGFTDAAPLLAYKAKTSIGRMTAPGYCWISAAPYQFIVRSAQGAPLFSTFAEAYQATVSAAVRDLPCNSQQMADALKLKVGEMDGYADSDEGYPSNMQPALAYAAQSGAPGGKDAWMLFAGRSVKPDYSREPQFAIVPR